MSKQLTIKGAQGGTVSISLNKVVTAKKQVRALCHDTRQKILKYISDNGKTTVTPIYNKLGLEQSICSQHLAILRAAGLVTTERDGKCIYYSVNISELNKLNQAIEAV